MQENSGPEPHNRPTRLVLVGAGHAHLEVLRRFILTPPPHVELTLISLDDCHHYSGMVPGYLQGTYAEKAITVDLPGLAERANGRFIKAKAVGIDPKIRAVQLADADPVTYDLVSFNLGSQAAGAAVESVKQHAVLIKPFSQATHLRQRIQALAEKKKASVCHIAVVGGGAAGFEVACALDAVLEQAGQRRQISLFDASSAILAGYSYGFRNRAERILDQKKIAVFTNQRVCGVRSDSVELGNSSSAPSNLTVWLSGAAASPVFHDCGLSVDDRGFLLVNEALHSVDDACVFGVGDCSTLVAYPQTPKAGVYAVRQGPVLWESLTTVINGKTLPHYEPQSGFLSILNTADGKALLRYKSIVSHSRWAWKLKDWVDRRFMRRYQGLIKSHGRFANRPYISALRQQRPPNDLELKHRLDALKNGQD